LDVSSGQIDDAVQCKSTKFFKDDQE